MQINCNPPYSCNGRCDNSYTHQTHTGPELAMNTLSGFYALSDVSRPGTRSAALILSEDAQGRLLLQLRDSDKPIRYPGHWSLFGGGIEPGETPLDAAVREFEEETGLTPGAEAFHPLAVTLASQTGRECIYIFSTRLDIKPADIRTCEGAGFAFFTPAQLEGLHLVPYLNDVFAFYLAQKSSNALSYMQTKTNGV